MRTAHAAVKRAAHAYDRVRRPPAGVVVLAYHRVGGGSGLQVDLDPALFAEQMHELAESGRAVSLDEGLDRVAGAAGSPAVAVTFDDGTADFTEHALPALVEANVHATYYVATQFIEEQRSFPDQGTPLSWSALAEAVSTGLVSVGSHTHSHAVLDKVTPDVADEELRTSVGLIEDRLGVPADHFAYPKGVFGGAAVEQAVARHVRSAALANCRVNRFGATDPLRLDRTPIQTADGMTWFRAKVDGGLQLEGMLRNRLNRRRYQGATN